MPAAHELTGYRYDSPMVRWLLKRSAASPILRGVYVTRECAAAVELQAEMDEETRRVRWNSDEPLLDTGMFVFAFFMAVGLVYFLINKLRVSPLGDKTKTSIMISPGGAGNVGHARYP